MFCIVEMGQLSGMNVQGTKIYLEKSTYWLTVHQLSVFFNSLLDQTLDKVKGFQLGFCLNVYDIWQILLLHKIAFNLHTKKNQTNMD